MSNQQYCSFILPFEKWKRWIKGNKSLKIVEKTFELICITNGYIRTSRFIIGSIECCKINGYLIEISCKKFREFLRTFWAKC